LWFTRIMSLLKKKIAYEIKGKYFKMIFAFWIIFATCKKISKRINSLKESSSVKLFYNLAELMSCILYAN